MEDISRIRSFQDLIEKSDKPVLVDFYADWCGPCKMVSPVIKRIAAEYKGRLVTVKVDTDRKPGIAAKYEITSIPTIILFKGGQPAIRLQGAQPYESIRASIEPHLI